MSSNDLQMPEVLIRAELDTVLHSSLDMRSVEKTLQASGVIEAIVLEACARIARKLRDKAEISTVIIALAFELGRRVGTLEAKYQTPGENARVQ